MSDQVKFVMDESHIPKSAVKNSEAIERTD
jgi:hypothetical protein